MTLTQKQLLKVTVSIDPFRLNHGNEIACHVTILVAVIFVQRPSLQLTLLATVSHTPATTAALVGRPPTNNARFAWPFAWPVLFRGHNTGDIREHFDGRSRTAYVMVGQWYIRKQVAADGSRCGDVEEVGKLMKNHSILLRFISESSSDDHWTCPSFSVSMRSCACVWV